MVCWLLLSLFFCLFGRMSTFGDPGKHVHLSLAITGKKAHLVLTVIGKHVCHTVTIPGKQIYLTLAVSQKQFHLEHLHLPSVAPQCTYHNLGGHSTTAQETRWTVEELWMRIALHNGMAITTFKEDRDFFWIIWSVRDFHGLKFLEVDLFFVYMLIYLLTYDIVTWRKPSC